MTGLLLLKHPELAALLLSLSQRISIFIRDVPVDHTRGPPEIPLGTLVDIVSGHEDLCEVCSA